MKYLPLAILFAVVLGCGNSSINKTSSANATPEPPPIAVTPAQLAQKYKSNELAADGEYRGKRLEITGKIKDIKEVLGVVSVDLEAPNYMVVNCTFPDERRPEVTLLKTGQTTTLIGTGNGLFGSTIIDVDDCRVKQSSSSPRSASPQT